MLKKFLQTLHCSFDRVQFRIKLFHPAVHLAAWCSDAVGDTGDCNHYMKNWIIFINFLVLLFEMVIKKPLICL